MSSIVCVASPAALSLTMVFMRVIAGTHRSRLLSAPPGWKTRPTSDRLRETLFNILAPRIAGARFADLYAGTGAVGIEALSRGAHHVWFAEDAPAALASLRKNLVTLKLTAGYTLEDRGVASMLERLAGNAKSNTAAKLDIAKTAAKPAPTLDIVFLDPPYEAADEYTRTLDLLGSARGRSLLAPGCIVIAEHNSKSSLAPRYGALKHARLHKQGDAALSFYSLHTKTESNNNEA